MIYQCYEKYDTCQNVFQMIKNQIEIQITVLLLRIDLNSIKSWQLRVFLTQLLLKLLKRSSRQDHAIFEKFRRSKKKKKEDLIAIKT